MNMILELTLHPYNPVFNTFLKKKVSQAAYTAGCETFISFTNTRYTIYFFV